MTYSTDCVVVGAGVVGLAVACTCAQAGLETIVLESEGAIGSHTSSRNSEVIHAGIYYEPGSLKARLCVAGRQALYDYCRRRGVATRQCGKLIVATRDSQRPTLDSIWQRAMANGVTDLDWLEQDAVRAMEPAVKAVAALWSPSTGIIDSHALMLALQGDLEAAGGMVVLRSPVVAGRSVSGQGGGTHIELDVSGDQPTTLRARYVINCAGLAALDIARRFSGLRADSLPRGRMLKGSYFALSGATPFSRLIYPVPEPGGLGIHLTLDLNGRARFGPDVEPVDSLDYTVDASRAALFEDAIRRYWPGLPDHALTPDYAGIRPQLHPPEGANTLAAADFMIQGQNEHGVPGLINLFGIESPGLTACLALAEAVHARLQDH